MNYGKNLLSGNVLVVILTLAKVNFWLIQNVNYAYDLLPKVEVYTNRSPLQ